MITKPLGFAGQSHQTTQTRHGWSKGLQLAPDLYPGVGGKRFRAVLLQRAYEFAGGERKAPEAIIDAVELLHAGSLVIAHGERRTAAAIAVDPGQHHAGHGKALIEGPRTVLPMPDNC